jgi:hypothetical protein
MIPRPRFSVVVLPTDTSLYLTPSHEITAHCYPSSYVPSVSSPFPDCTTSCTPRTFNKPHPIHLHISCFLYSLARFSHDRRVFHSLSYITTRADSFDPGHSFLRICAQVGCLERLCSTFPPAPFPCYILVRCRLIPCIPLFSLLAFIHLPSPPFRRCLKVETMYHHLSSSTVLPVQN